MATCNLRRGIRVACILALVILASAATAQAGQQPAQPPAPQPGQKTGQPTDKPKAKPFDPSKPLDEDALEDLGRAAQNPVSSLISVPFQNNLQVLEDGNVFNVLLIQPVVPFQLSSSWNLATRTIFPVLALEGAPPGNASWALGDIQQAFFLTPTASTSWGLTWGAGANFSYPSATDDIYGSGKWSVGPSFVGLTLQGPWVVGVLVNNVWSFAGDSDRPDFNQFTMQPFINYNLDGGWFLQSAPLITANWEIASGSQWTVPLGGGVGRTFTLGGQPVNMILTNFYNVTRPTGGPAWNIRYQMTLLFPR